MNKSTLLRFNGYSITPCLFGSNKFHEFEQIDLNSNSQVLTNNVEFKNQRLGKLVEEFVFFQLKQDDSVEWILENVQIQQEQKTIGELDALYGKNGKTVHLEIVYKFYLYDNLNDSGDPLSYWIGPNRKDTLVYKLDRLKTKQFPLLFNEVTQKQLSEHQINTTEIKQQLCFKAQLFLPYNTNIDIEPLNSDCVNGFYLSFNDISLLIGLEFFIPEKLDWLVTPHKNVDWNNYQTAIISIGQQIKAQRSPLVWLKCNETKLKKCFITWW